MTALQEGKLGPGLKKFLTDEVLGKGKGKDSLLVVDKHLGMFSYVVSDIRSDFFVLQRLQYQKSSASKLQLPTLNMRKFGEVSEVSLRLF